MQLDRRALLGAAATLALAGTAHAAASADQIVLTTKYGKAVIQLRPDLAPKAVKQMETLTKEGFYNGLKFHRVIDGFMAQTGDPTGTGSGGSKLPDLPAEFSAEPFERGTIGMARTQDPNSANSQFFICFKPAPFLNNQYTVVGKVISGMDAIDKIKRGEPDSGSVDNPDTIVSMAMAK
ncbi:putative peptidyl-prolyl cis-trans isomerase [Beijerinckiaceae bacterium RH AL1]|nr:putative peptidyl-prolyl cis-trans isomerase [Beijerinckiaceae bacterium RH CH11]VVB46723.1 putative peptidyl-prolyl cis-trans isomerase [Beijerinckiaceae bacterium RH AL8]VVC55476.1 putative peptidyl-prolyl cis-trans isomerase [Beijerinckiaceae bacterium RH AL1]